MAIPAEVFHQHFNPTKVLSFDLETTSANPFQARIVTSALVHIDATGAHPRELLADPGMEIPAEATQVHGITTEYAKEHGRPHAEVLAETIAAINEAWVKGYTLIVYNAAYDLTVLHTLEPTFLVTGPVYDPFVIDKICDPYRKGKRTLTDLCQEYGVKLENAHEATSDALAAARIAWMQAKRRFSTKITGQNLEELMEFQAVGYYHQQTDFKKYLQGKGRDTKNINTAWPLQSSDNS